MLTESQERLCRMCNQPIFRRRDGHTCGACVTARCRGRLPQRLEQVREKLARCIGVRQPGPRLRPQAAPVAQDAGLVVNARVVLKSDPPERGRILARERDGWIVWVDGWGRMKAWPNELRLEDV